MRFLRLFIAAAALVASSTGAFAAEPKNGTDYKTLATPVRSETGKKVEVVEFFMYTCPHCFALEPRIAAWVKKQGDNIVFHRVHLAFSGPADPLAHTYATLEAMGKLDGVHDKIFHAIHIERTRLNTDAALQSFVVANGVDQAKYQQFFNSFAVQTKLKRNAALITAAQIDSAPTIVIDGRYVTAPSMTSRPGMNEPQAQEAVLQVMDSLVQKSLKEKGAGEAPAAAAKK
jgi:thiol:disulfide interchange protein DsbA